MDYHTGSRNDRAAAVGSIPENEWKLDTLLDLLGGLGDHGWQVREKAQKKLLELACNANLKPLVLHPKDLAFRYITPGTYENTFAIVRKMKQIELPAKEICEHFFNRLKFDAKEKQRQSLEILEGSELENVAKNAEIYSKKGG